MAQRDLRRARGRRDGRQNARTGLSFVIQDFAREAEPHAEGRTAPAAVPPRATIRRAIFRREIYSTMFLYRTAAVSHFVPTMPSHIC